MKTLFAAVVLVLICGCAHQTATNDSSTVEIPEYKRIATVQLNGATVIIDEVIRNPQMRTFEVRNGRIPKQGGNDVSFSRSEGGLPRQQFGSKLGAAEKKLVTAPLIYT